MLFDNNNIFIYTFICISVFNFLHGISYSYIAFCRHNSADSNSRFFTGCCWVKTNVIAQTSILDERSLVWSFGIFSFLLQMIDICVCSRKYLFGLIHSRRISTSCWFPRICLCCKLMNKLASILWYCPTICWNVVLFFLHCLMLKCRAEISIVGKIALLTQQHVSTWSNRQIPLCIWTLAR